MSSIRPTSVEPLPRAAWERIEAQVFARLDRGEHLHPSPSPIRAVRSGQLWAVSGVFAAAAALLLWWNGVPLDRNEPQATSPIAAASVPVQQETALSTGDTSRETTLVGAQLVLAPHSSAVVSGSDEAGWRVRLDGGQADFAVEPRRGRPPFVVYAGDAQVWVVGTRFTVQRLGSSAGVSVTEGRVNVVVGTSQVLLGPGDSWPSSPPAPAAAPRKELNAAAPASSASARAAIEAQRRFLRAGRLESQKPEAALAIYRELSRNGGPWAANALFARARLELELERPRRAEPLLREYLRRHPQGVNAKDARELLERAAPSETSPTQ